MGGEEIRVAMWSSWAGARVYLRFTSVTLKWDWSAQVCAFLQRCPPAQGNTDTHTQPQHRVGRQLSYSVSSIMGPLTRTARELRLLAGEGLASWNLSWIRAKIMTQGKWLINSGSMGLEGRKRTALAESVGDVSWKEEWSAIWAKFQEAHRWVWGQGWVKTQETTLSGRWGIGALGSHTKMVWAALGWTWGEFKQGGGNDAVGREWRGPETWGVDSAHPFPAWQERQGRKKDVLGKEQCPADYPQPSLRTKWLGTQRQFGFLIKSKPIVL